MAELVADLGAERVATPPPGARVRLPRRRLTRQQLRRILFVLGPVLALLLAGYYYLTGGRYIATDDAYVRAETVNLATDVAGIVAAVDVHDNERVAKGQELFRLDDAPFRIAVQNAQAQLGVVRNDLDALKASYRQKQDSVRLAESDVAFYEREFARKQALVGQSIASRQSFDQARHDLDTARGRLAELQQELAGIAAKLSGDPNLPVERQPRYLAALAQVEAAKRNLRHTVVRAPMAGIVTNVPSLTPGSYLAAGTTAFNLVAADHVWIAADPKETQLAHARPGQPVTVTVDTYPGVTWHGTLESLSPASASSFALLPAQNTSGNWVKVVQRIPLRVRLDSAPGKPQLRAGMSAEIEIDTGRQRRLPQALAALFRLG